MKKKVYFLLGGYPVVSQTFLYNQILEVSKQTDVEVKIIVFARTDEDVHEVYRSLDMKVLLFELPTVSQSIKKARSFFKSFFSLLFLAPTILFKCMNLFRFGRNCINYIILSDYFRQIKPDILHCHFGQNANVAVDLKGVGAIKCKILTSFHGMDITVLPLQYGKKYYTRLFQVGDMFTGNSTFIINKMIDAGCPVDKVVKIPECLNIDQFSFRDNPPTREPFRILTVGRFVEKKGYQYSLKAIEQFSKHGIPFEYHIVGDGPLLNQMVVLAKKLKIDKFITFHGAMKQERLKELYNDTHVFMLPSVTASNGDTEGQGLVLQEAQAVGIPVLATLHNGFPDSIIDGESGFLVPEKDFQGLYEKLLLFYNNDLMSSTFGKRGRVFVEQTFDSRVVITSLLKLYSDLLT